MKGKTTTTTRNQMRSRMITRSIEGIHNSFETNHEFS